MARERFVQLGLCLALSLTAGAASPPVTLYFDDQLHYERSIAPGEVHAYVITLRAGEFVRFLYESAEADTELVVEDPAGTTLARIHERGTTDSDPIIAVTAMAGRHRLLVKSASRPGTYTVVVAERRPAVPEDARRFEVQGLLAEAEDLILERTTAADRRVKELGQRAINLLLTLNDTRALVRAINNRGVAETQLGESQAALLSFSEVLSIRQCHGMPPGWVLNNLAIALQDLGHDRDSIRYLSATLRQERLDPIVRAVSLYMLGQVHSKLGDEKIALDYYLQSLPVAEQSGDRGGYARVLNRLGMTYAALGEWRDAFLYYGKSIAVRKEVGDKRGEAGTLANIGILYLDSGDTDRAVEFFRQSVDVARQIGDQRSTAVVLHRIGDAQRMRGEMKEATASYQQALKLYREAKYRSDEALVLLGLGRIAAADGDASAALGHYAGAMEASRDRLQQAFITVAIADAKSASGRRDDALAAINDATSIFRAAAHQRGETEALFIRARINESNGNLDAAREDAEAAFRLVERLRANISSLDTRALFLASHSEIADLYIRVLMRLHARRPADRLHVAAFEASERARARSLADHLREPRTATDAAQTRLIKRQREIRAILSAKAEAQLRAMAGRNSQEVTAAIGREMEQLSAEYDQVAAQLHASDSRFASTEIADVRTIQRDALDLSTALLEYYLGTRASFLWVIRKNAVHAIELPPAPVIESAVRTAYDALAARRNDREALRTLAAMLIAPALPHCKNVRRFLIAGDGALQYLPFAALPSLRDEHQPLIADFELVSVPSGAAIALLRRSAGRSTAPNALAVFADPVFDRSDERVAGRRTGPQLPPDADLVRSAKESGLADGLLPRLPFTRREAMAIADLVPAAERKTALDFDASRKTALAADMRRYRIVHFATHGLLNSLHPELSGIVLTMVDAQGNDQRGFLSVADVANMSLNADLVVLSGCRTALGKEIKGEGISGLTRAFMQAGAPRVVASLWKVNDAATAELMKHFYSEMLGTARQPAAAALRAAQLSLARSKRWSDPYYWAAFVLQGDWN